MDSDRILVGGRGKPVVGMSIPYCVDIQLMSNGQIKEFDSPYKLLQDPSSLFYKMVQKTGPSASKKLHQMARDTHTERNRY